MFISTKVIIKRIIIPFTSNSPKVQTNVLIFSTLQQITNLEIHLCFDMIGLNNFHLRKKTKKFFYNNWNFKRLINTFRDNVH